MGLKNKGEVKPKGRSKLKWIIVLTFGGILLYLILGAMLPFVKTKKVDEEFQKNFDLSEFYGEKDKYSSDRAAIVEDSQDALDIRIKMLDEAKESIILATFDIREGKSAEDVFSTILAAADRGVKVQILVDGLYGGLHMSGVPMFYAIGNHPNIEIRFYSIPNPLKPWTINGRMHDKYIIIDNKLLLLGGRNTFDYFLGEYNEKNLSYDRDVLVFNTDYTNSVGVIKQVKEYFTSVWNLQYCKPVFNKGSKSRDKEVQQAAEDMKTHYNSLLQNRPELFTGDTDYTKATVPVNKITLIYNPTHILAKEPFVWYQIEELLKAAKERGIIHTPYAALSNDMYKGMAEIAGNVEQFEMLLNSTAVGDNFMASSDYTLNRKKILNTGVDIYEFQGEYSSHGKSILIDHDISIIGTYNLDMRSTYVDTETMLVIHGEEFNKLLEKNLMDIKGQSLKVLMDGTYEENPDVIPVELSGEKKILFRITSVIFQLFRFVI